MGIYHRIAALKPRALKRHFELKDSVGKDPLNAVALAQGRHKTDAQNYRVWDTERTPAKEGGLLSYSTFRRRTAKE